LGLFTIFIKIRAHWGEFLNEKADRWANKGREDINNVRWDGPSLQPTFSWTEEGVEHRCSMNNTLQTRVHLKVSELQLPLHKNHTSEFLKREDNSRHLLGKHWQDKTVQTGPRGVLCKVSATNSHVPSFLSSGVFEIMMSVDSVNASTRR